MNTDRGGQIVEVEGGPGEQNHERNTIQFYNVQEGLGYDRPSKATDWLIKKAKASIDELPAAPIVNLDNGNLNYHRLMQLEGHLDDDVVDNHMGNAQNSSFLPASLALSTSAELLLRTGSQKTKSQALPLQSVEGSSTYFDGSGGFGFNSLATQTTSFVGKPTTSRLLNYISPRGNLQSTITLALPPSCSSLRRPFPSPSLNSAAPSSLPPGFDLGKQGHGSSVAARWLPAVVFSSSSSLWANNYHPRFL
ncbi:hypothetical protein L1987_40551 [Smallanthus sonchifolius]|uniref:Uncharacterized protein n=1 Tax=Smallanthus sonchifolius TaxID=185202 RepID=A0ACB9GT57_9ASTR|nr:hypothetical protein L1987_40551 [Smallanthus sonchifolius]